MATPEQEEQVRRALAAAARADDAERGTGQMPDHVAGRLDDVLAELVAQRSPRPAPRDELAQRRTRRWPQVLVAAATVAVIAVAGGAVALRGMQGSGAGSASSGAADSGAGQAAPSAPQAGGQALAGGAAAVPELHLATLRRDVRAVVESGPVADRVRGAVPSPAQSPARSAAPSAGAKAAEACATPTLPSGADAVAVRLDGQPAVLVLGPVQDGTRAARVYSCGDTRAPVASTRVRAR